MIAASGFHHARQVLRSASQSGPGARSQVANMQPNASGMRKRVPLSCQATRAAAQQVNRIARIMVAKAAMISLRISIEQSWPRE